MKKTKSRRLAAMAASLLCCLIFTVPAYAQSSEPQPETPPRPRWKPKQSRKPRTPLPRTGREPWWTTPPTRTAKEFYTITTADESMFYLVIDKQKTSENVYFLNTVTADDLLPLAEQGKEPNRRSDPRARAEAHRTLEETGPNRNPRQKKDSPSSLLSSLIGAVVLIGGGAGYYFKIYKPKHEAPDLEDDYCEYEDEAPEEMVEDCEEPEDEDTPPWEEDETEDEHEFYKQPL